MVRKGEGRLGWPARIVFAFALIASGVLGAWLLTEEVEPPIAGSEPLTVPLVDQLTDGRVTSELLVEWGPSVEVVAPAWEGLVTQVLVDPGARVEEGDTVVAIDGIGRIALALTEPLHRRLPPGSVGNDVASLRLALERLGYLPAGPGTDEPGRLDPEMQAAVQAMGADLGRPARGVVIDPSWVVVIPDGGMTVDQLLLVRGAPAPGAGQVILASSRPLLSASVRVGPEDDDQYVFTFDNVARFDLEGVEVEKKSLAELDATLLRMGIGPEYAEAIVGEMLRANLITVVNAPASAVAVSATGEACLWEPGSDTPLRTDVVASQLGIVSLRPTDRLAPGTVVVADPSDSDRSKC